MGNIKSDVVIVGTGGFAREIAFLLENSKENQSYKFIGFIENNCSIGTKIGISRVIGNDRWLLNNPNKIGVIVAIGDSKSRKKLVEEFSSNKNIFFPNIIASTAIISNEVNMGVGNIFCDGTVVTVDIKMGNFNIFNLGTTVGHETIIGNYVTINPGTNISGNVVLGNMISVGTGVKIIPTVKIADNVTIGAGTVVIENIEENSTVVGNPGRVIRKKTYE